MSDDLFSAIHGGDLQRVSRLIEREPQLARARNQNGVSAVMQAVYEHKPEIVEVCATRQANSIFTKQRPSGTLAGFMHYSAGDMTLKAGAFEAAALLNAEKC